MHLYSKSTNSFYDSSINKQIPGDAVELSDDQYQSLLVAGSERQAIVSDQNGNPTTVDPTTLMTLEQAQANQTALMYQGYQAAVTQNVSFKSAGGVTQTYQADTNSQNILLQSYTGFSASGSVPTGFYWVAADNTQVAFTLADLKGLYQAMLAQGWTAFQQLQDRKTSIRAAATVAAVQAITW